MYGQEKSSEFSPKEGVSGSPIPPTAKAMGILGLGVMKNLNRELTTLLLFFLELIHHLSTRLPARIKINAKCIFAKFD